MLTTQFINRSDIHRCRSGLFSMRSQDAGPKARHVLFPQPRVAVHALNTPGNETALYRITRPGTYYLTNNIVGVAGKAGIEIAADDVTLDLMGFELIGAPHTREGVRVLGSLTKNIVVRRGGVRGWGGDGVEAVLVEGGRLENVAALNNHGIGLNVGDQWTLRKCTACGNGETGIHAGRQAAAIDCLAAMNAKQGIRAGADSALRACIMFDNGSDAA